MAELAITAEHVSGFIHNQTLPNSPRLFYLHHTIFKAIKTAFGTTKQVVFQEGVYWLLLYTACTLLLTGLGTDVYDGFHQNSRVQNVLRVRPEKQLIDVDGMWNFINATLLPGLGKLQDTSALSLTIKLKIIWEILHFDRLRQLEGRYEVSVRHSDEITWDIIQDMRESDWIDENTRHVIIDFSLVNVHSHIISTYRIAFDYRRVGVFWHTKNYQFYFEREKVDTYYLMLLGFSFMFLSAVNIFKEAQK
ncbi:hypothetical protein ElyMa_000425700, partial [Elysia marginata]